MKVNDPRILPFAVVFAILFTMRTVQAQPSDAPFGERAPSSTVTKETIAAGEFDLAQIDVSASLDLLSGGPLDPDVGSIKEEAESYLQRLRDAGVSKVYLTVPSRALVRGAACFIVPCNDTESVRGVLSEAVEMVAPGLGYTVLERDTDVVVCPAMVADLFQEQPQQGESAARGEIDDAFASVDQYPHQFVFDLPSDLQREVAAIWPDVVPLLGSMKISPRRIVETTESVAVGWTSPPEMQLEMRIACTGDEAAKQLHDELAPMVALLPAEVPGVELRLDSTTVVATLSGGGLQAFITGVTGPPRQQAHHMATSNNAKQLALAMHKFHADYGFFPGKYTVDDQGKPLLSWRVALLPYLEMNDLYEKFRRDEPWDSLHNRALLAEMPRTFAVHGETLPAGQTRMRLPVIEGSAWSGEGPPIEIKDFTDGTSNTLWLAVAPESAAVPWTKPDEWELDAEKLIEGFFADSEMTIVGIFDGSVRTLSREIDPKVLRALLTIAGGEVIDNEQIK